MYQNFNNEPQISSLQETREIATNGACDPVSNSENPFLLTAESSNKNDRHEMTSWDLSNKSSSAYVTSDSGKASSDSHGQHTAMVLKTTDLPSAIAAELEEHDSASLQASMEALLVASATPEIHSQYELATIEEQPELGYQSDSSDTECRLMMSSAGRNKNNKNNISSAMKKKSANTASTMDETSGTASADHVNKCLAPVIEDMLEGNEI